jgi:hypothetical protein
MLAISSTLYVVNLESKCHKSPELVFFSVHDWFLVYYFFLFPSIISCLFVFLLKLVCFCLCMFSVIFFLFFYVQSHLPLVLLDPVFFCTYFSAAQHHQPFSYQFAKVLSTRTLYREVGAPCLRPEPVTSVSTVWGGE